MLVVFDTNVLISAIFWRGAPYRCVLAATGGLCQMVLSEPILHELREKLLGKFSLSPSAAEEVVGHFKGLGTLVALPGRGGGIAAAPDEEKRVETALVAGAGVIVSGDHHLLECGVVEGSRVISTGQLLELIAESGGRA